MAGPDQDGDAPWLTLAEAAARSGRHIDAIRTMARRGKLERRKGNAGQWLVRMPSRGLTDPDRASDAASDIGGDAGLADVVAELKEEVTELRVALARSEAGRDAALAQVRAEGEARAAKAEAELAAEHRLNEELKRQLAEARRGWLERLIAAWRRR